MKISVLFAVLALVAVCECGNHTTRISTKLGIAHDLKGQVNGNTWNTGKISWYYSWSVFKANGANREFIPMLWGPSHASEFTTAYNNGVFNGSPAILGFNEPEQAGQANISPATAVSLWNQHLQPKASKFRLGAPAVSSAPAGLTWLTNFMNQCGGCSISFIPIHWYGSNPLAFQAYVKQIHDRFNKPIWVTEWACVQYSNSDPDCSQNQVYNFMGQTTLWLDQQSYVERFAWFGCRVNGIPATNALLNTDGASRTGLGNQYITVGGHS